MKIQIALDLTIEDDADPDALTQQIIDALIADEMNIWTVINSVDDGQWTLSAIQF